MTVKAKIIVLLALIGSLYCCKKKSTNQNVANNCVYSNALNYQVNFTILSGSTQFSAISIPAGYTYVSGQSPNGILIYRLNQNQFVAFDRSCTYDGCNNTKAIIWVQTGNTSVKDSTCGSTYNITDGSVITGPATVPLYQYHNTWDGNQLHIYN